MDKFSKVIALLVPLTGLGLWGSDATAAIITSTTTGGAWGTATTWVGGVVPAATDSAVIATTAGNAVTVTTNSTIAAVTVNAGAILAIAGGSFTVNGLTDVFGTLSHTNTGGTETYVGSVIIETGGTWDNTINESMTFRAGLTNNGTFIGGTAGTYTFSAGTQSIGGTVAITIPNLRVSNGVVLTNTGTLTVTTAISAGGGGGGNLTNGANATLNIGGTIAPTTFTATAAGNTVNYYGGAQTVFATAYNNLTLSGTGAKTITTATTTVNGVLSMEGTATASAAPTYGANATLRYNTATARTVGVEWITPFAATGGVIIANTGAITLNAAKVLNVSVPLTINSGATLNTGNFQVTFGGNFINNGGTFTAGSSPIVIANTMVTQSIAGFTTTGLVSMTKTAGTATFTGNVNGAGLTINGTGGTLNLGTGLTHTFTGAWTTTAGTLNGGSSTLNIGGNCSAPPPGSTFTAGTGTVDWNAAGAQTVCQYAYFNLILSNSGAKTMAGVTTIAGDLSISGSATMTLNAAFTATGALNYSSTGTTTLTAATPISIGTFNQSAGTLIDNGNTITVTGTGIGTWTQSGGTFTPTGTVTFTGAAPQIGTSSFNNLLINVGAGNTATLVGNSIVSGILTLTNGIISTGANILEVASSCATGMVGGATTNYVLGNLRLHYPVGTTTCTFPIGTAGVYAPVAAAITSVTSTLANSSLTARTDTPDYADTTAGTSGISATKSVNRYWTLTPGASLTYTSYNATFTFVAGDIDAGAVTANFIIGRKNTGLWSYPTMGAANPTNTTATGMAQAGGFGIYVIGERPMPSLTILKTVATYSDPVNLLVNPKFIPGGVAQYAILSSNSGGPADINTTVITDPVPTNTLLYVNDIGGAGSGPVLFTQGTTSSTLTYTFTALNSTTDDISFSNDGGATWVAVPVADALGCDATIPAITHFRVNPKGTFYGSAIAPQPTFQLNFRVCVK